MKKILLIFYVILLIYGSDGRRKSKKRLRETSSEVSSYRNLDLRGRLRKSLFVVCYLIIVLFEYFSLWQIFVMNEMSSDINFKNILEERQIFFPRRMIEFPSHYGIKYRDLEISVDVYAILAQYRKMINALENLAQNTICSPMSALLPIGKLALGARNTTLEELLEGVGVISQQKIKPHFKRLIAELRYLPGVKLDLASRLYIDQHAKLVSSFESEAKEIFNSSVVKADFESPVITADKINAWVESQTADMIHDMISPDDISPDSSVIMINAIYFNGKWAMPFHNIQTSTFHTPSDVRRILMMSTTGLFNYTESGALDSQILKLPYVGGVASLIIVLPKARNGLPLLLSQIKLAPEILDSALAAFWETTLQVTIPKFKISAEMDLRKLYERIGIKRMFNAQESGLSNIVREKTVFVSKAKQKAVIDVNERGTEASAATSTTLIKLSLPQVKFRADHPFLFMVLSHKQQIFAGTLVHPDVAKA